MNVDYFDFENYEYYDGLEKNVVVVANENLDGNYNDEEEEEND